MIRFLKNIFGKKTEKDEKDIPKIFNALYEFNHDNIIEKSKEKEKPLIGNAKSNTLFLETEKNKLSAKLAFVFIGSTGVNYYTAFKKRFPKDEFKGLILTETESLNSLDTKLTNLGYPNINYKEDTFLKGYDWYDSNNDKLSDILNKIFKEVETTFIISSNSRFEIGLTQKIIDSTHALGPQPILVLHLPHIEEEKQKQINALAFMYQLLQAEVKKTAPFFLFDEMQLLKSHPKRDTNNLIPLLYPRISNCLIDLCLSIQLSSKLYRTEEDNFHALFKNTKGPAKLLSFDIYDQSTELSYLLKKTPLAYSYTSEDIGTRGMIIVQPSLSGLNTKQYLVFREYFANKDVQINIIKERQVGSLIRGLVLFSRLPKHILNRYTILEQFRMQVLDEEEATKESFDLIELSRLWEYKNYHLKEIEITKDESLKEKVGDKIIEERDEKKNNA